MRLQGSVRSRPALVCAAWLTATTAMAQASPPTSPLSEKPQAIQAPSSPKPASAPTTVSPLTVEAQRNRAVLREQARGFVESYAAPTIKLGQYPRWYPQQVDLTMLGDRSRMSASVIKPVDVILPGCVSVTGVAPEQAAQIKGQVEKAARAVGAPLAPRKCTPNIEILFTTEPQRELDAIVARSPAILGYQGEKTVTHPIQGWYVTASLGEPPPPDRGLAQQGAIVDTAQSKLVFDKESERIKDTLGVRTAEHGRQGRLCVDTSSPICSHAAFLNVLVIVDVGHMGDVSVDLTSDYVAMLALSQPRSLDGCMALPSVIDLYAKDCPGRDPPSGLTSADMAYLTSLYVADLTVDKSREQSDIAGRMVEIILSAAKQPSR